MGRRKPISCGLCVKSRAFRRDNFARHLRSRHGSFLEFLKCHKKVDNPIKLCVELHENDFEELKRLETFGLQQAGNSKNIKWFGKGQQPKKSKSGLVLPKFSGDIVQESLAQVIPLSNDSLGLDTVVVDAPANLGIDVPHEKFWDNSQPTIIRLDVQESPRSGVTHKIIGSTISQPTAAGLEQKWATYSPRVESTPRKIFIRPAGDFERFQGQRRNEEVDKLMKGLNKQQTYLIKIRDDTDNIIRASYIVSQKIATHSKNYSDGEFVKECLQAVVDIFCLGRKKIDDISLSRKTVTKRIDELATSIETCLTELTSKFKYFSLAIDGSTDVSDTAQLAVFVRGIDADFNITEEMLGLQAMKDTTTGEDIFQELKILMAKFNLSFEKLHGVSTDRAPAMVGSKVGLTSKIKSELASLNLDTKEFSVFHCIIHEQSLCAKSLKFAHVMSKVVLSINFIKSQALNHSQFKEFLEDIEAEYGDLVYYCDVRWLNKGKILKQFYNLRSEIFTFMEMKGNSIPELSDDGWVRDLAFLVDFTSHLNDLNSKLQGKGQFIHQSYSHIKTFQNKIQLWERQLRKGNTFHFPTLANHNKSDCTSLANELILINIEFSNRFHDFRSQETNLRILSSPFDANVDQAPEELQMELIELQGNEDLKRKMRDYSLLEFYKNLPKEAFPRIIDFARKKMSLFGSTYKCQQLFLRMKYTRSRLTDHHLQNNLRVATSSISPDIDTLVKKAQAQISH